MSKMPKKKAKPSVSRRVAANSPSQADFDAVLGLIEAARTRAITAVNTTLIELYWSLGEYISRKTVAEGWGKGTVEILAATIQKRYPGRTGYSARNLWRMSQFFQTYRDQPKLSPLVTELPWTHNLLIMSRSKGDEEREFYLRLCIREKWGKRELERQLAGALFERVVLSPTKLSAPLRELHPDAANVFKDSYLIEFADLPRAHSEGDLEHGLIAIVEYALSRAMSPALVAEYQTNMPDKKLLQAKLREFYELAEQQATRPALETENPATRRPSKPGKARKK